MALTKKAVVYLGLAYLFIGFALVFRQPTLTIFVIPIALTFFYSSLLSHIQIPNLTITRKLNPLRSFGGETIKVTLEILNNLNVELNELHLEDQVPNSLHLESGSNTFSLSLKPHERTEHFYEISAPRRGQYALGPLKATSMDTMRFRQFSLRIPGQDRVMILPQVEDLGQVDVTARRVGPWPGTVPSRSVGPGTEFFELRLYSPGDELRRINWKASARQARLVTNEFETERVTDVLVALDCSESVLSSVFSFDAEELEVNLAASLCSQLLLQGNRVGLLVYGAERTWVSPAFGKHQLLRILSGLTITKAGRAIIPIDFAVETIVNAVLPARSVIAFISPLMGDAIVEVVRSVAAAGYNVICVTPSIEASTRDEPRSNVLARKILETERRINLRQIASIAKCVEVSPHTSIRVLSRRRFARKFA
ncbi:MAG: DUF58 domain-containing protein [Candidatus Bathyarchaeia archaeon]